MVDADRPVKRHGMPPRQLICEFAALGLQPVRRSRLAGSDAYFAAFKIGRARGRQPAADQALRGQRPKAGPSAACCCSRAPANIRWSRIARSIASPARASLRVARQSASLGRGSPLGWLWARTTPALPSLAASATMSRTGRSTDGGSPSYVRRGCSGPPRRHGRPTAARAMRSSAGSRQQKSGARLHGR